MFTDFVISVVYLGQGVDNSWKYWKLPEFEIPPRTTGSVVKFDWCYWKWLKQTNKQTTVAASSCKINYLLSHCRESSDNLTVTIAG